MGRRPVGSTPRNNLVGVRFTDKGLSSLDDMRGEMSRQDFLRMLLAREHTRQRKDKA